MELIISFPIRRSLIPDSKERARAPAYLEGAHERFIDAHHAAGVVELAAVVGGGEEGDQLTLGEELVPVLNNLMRGRILEQTS